jgi:hypothetical protein
MGFMPVSCIPESRSDRRQNRIQCPNQEGGGGRGGWNEREWRKDENGKARISEIPNLSISIDIEDKLRIKRFSDSYLEPS